MKQHQEMIMLCKIGKKEWLKIDLTASLARITKRSKSEIKRLFKQGAIDIHIIEIGGGEK